MEAAIELASGTSCLVSSRSAEEEAGMGRGRGGRSRQGGRSCGEISGGERTICPSVFPEYSIGKDWATEGRELVLVGGCACPTRFSFGGEAIAKDAQGWKELVEDSGSNDRLGSVAAPLAVT